MVTVLLVWLENELINNNVSGEGDDCHAKTREHAAEHRPLGEDWVLPPRFPFGPRVPEETRSRDV